MQTDIAHVLMKISVRPGAANTEALVFNVREEVRKRLGPDLALEVEITDQFLTSPDGKTPTFKRLVSPGNRSAPAPAPDLTPA